MAGFKNIELKKYHYEPETKNEQMKGIKRVAAYARVSTLHEDQEDSFETQCAYYEQMIGSDPRMSLPQSICSGYTKMVGNLWLS